MGIDEVNLDEKIQESNTQTDSAPETVENTESEKTPAAQAVMDLSKAEKVLFEGKEWTPDDLRKSILRQQDYTKKTQELAQERETLKKESQYRENLEADIAKIKSNPALAEEFRKIYPKHYHWVLDQLGLKEASSPKGPELPREVLERLEKVDKLEQSFTQKEKETFNAKLESIEQGLQKKYSYANLTDVYGAADAFFKENNVQPNQVDDKMLEPFFKASHEYNVQQFKSWQQDQLKQTKEVNEKASDVGRGGGTPGQAPKRMLMKDVEDQILASGEF
jgi:hypothetical protein